MACEEFMKIALEEAYSGIKNMEGGPFGACIVKDGEVVASSHNTVLKDNDPTKHAEVKAISMASGKLKNFDLTGCEIYSTTEPCPMCLAAIHWARIDRLIYGTTIEDVKKHGFNELCIGAKHIKKMAELPLIIEEEFMKEDCLELLIFWNNLPDKRVY